MRWWEEIKSAGAIQFGGPTGIYNIIVLMSWWCSLLKNQPASEHSDCIRILDDIDRSILSATPIITDSSNYTPGPSRSVSEDPTSAVARAHQPRGSKRGMSEDAVSRKRLRLQAKA